MMYRHKNMAINLNNIRTMEIREGMGKSSNRWSIAITYFDNNPVFINWLEWEEANNLLNTLIKIINGGN